MTGARLFVVVPAAGGGSRFGGELPKQYASLAGRPVIAHALDRLAALQAQTTVVVLAPGDAHYARLVGELADDPVGGLLAVPVADTLKRAAVSADAGAGTRVLRTEDRASLWQAQTPQMFRCGLLRAALARPEALAATDEAGAIEALAATGRCPAPRLVRGSARNVKITYAADLALAAALLALPEEVA
jgi:2-C-methyl-D-erythritol 4-phosphate cytidylyltransferase